MATIEQIKARFLGKTVLNTVTGCLDWTASKFQDGYGQFRWDAKRPNLRAHRAAWELQYGPIPEGEQVLHRCDNPGCVLPEHLFLGTHQDNVTDKVVKRRHVTNQGLPSANLTDDQIDQIRELGPTMTQKQIAAQFGVTQGTVWDILHGKVRQTRKMREHGSLYTGHVRNKVTPQVIDEVIFLRHTCRMSQERIAAVVKVDQTTVSRILIKVAQQQKGLA